MTNPPANSPLNSQPRHLRSAPAAPPQQEQGEGASKVVGRQAVLSVLRSDPHLGDGRVPVAWLHIVAPKGAVSTATSVCECGRNRSAVGRAKVLALTEDHAAHRDACSLRNPVERRNAA